MLPVEPKSRWPRACKAVHACPPDSTWLVRTRCPSLLILVKRPARGKRDAAFGALRKSSRIGLFEHTLAEQNKRMPHTLWMPSLALALYRNRQAPSSRLVQFATIRADGRPANRTLSFRGFLHDSHRLMFVADARSHKAVELVGSPWAEGCWHFAVTQEQFRIGGPTRLIGEGTADPDLSAVRTDCWRRPQSQHGSRTRGLHPASLAILECRFLQTSQIPSRRYRISV